MDAATIISLVALGFSALSLYFTVKREKRDEVRFDQEQEAVAQRKSEGLLPKERAEVSPVGRSIERDLTLHLSWLASGVDHRKKSGAEVPVELP